MHPSEKSIWKINFWNPKSAREYSFLLLYRKQTCDELTFAVWAGNVQQSAVAVHHPLWTGHFLFILDDGSFYNLEDLLGGCRQALTDKCSQKLHLCGLHHAEVLSTVKAYKVDMSPPRVLVTPDRYSAPPKLSASSDPTCLWPCVQTQHPVVPAAILTGVNWRSERHLTVTVGCIKRKRSQFCFWTIKWTHPQHATIKSYFFSYSMKGLELACCFINPCWEWQFN